MTEVTSRMSDSGGRTAEVGGQRSDVGSQTSYIRHQTSVIGGLYEFLVQGKKHRWIPGEMED